MSTDGALVLALSTRGIAWAGLGVGLLLLGIGAALARGEKARCRFPNVTDQGDA